MAHPDESGILAVPCRAAPWRRHRDADLKSVYVTTLPATELPTRTHRSGDPYADYVAAVRRVQEAAVSIDIGSADIERATVALHALAERLERSPAYQADYVGTRQMALSSAQGPFSVPWTLHEARADYSAGTVRFSRFHHGRGGVAHGGATALLFDEVLGRMSNYPGEPPSRTAYLLVNYRAVAPIEKDLRVEAGIDRVEGRKKFSSGRLYDGDTLVADAEALFVVLRPGQP